MNTTQVFKIKDSVESLENAAKALYTIIMNDFLNADEPAPYIQITFPQVNQTLLVDLFMPDEIKVMIFKYVKNLIVREMNELKGIIGTLLSVASSLRVSDQNLEFIVNVKHKVLLANVPSTQKTQLASLCSVFIDTRTLLFVQQLIVARAQANSILIEQLSASLISGMDRNLENRLCILSSFL